MMAVESREGGSLFDLGRPERGMGWDGMGWDGMGWDGMGWDGMGWDGMLSWTAVCGV